MDVCRSFTRNETMKSIVNLSVASVTIIVTIIEYVHISVRLYLICSNHLTDIVKRHCDRIECVKNCVDVNFNVKNLNQLDWFRGNSFRIDLDKPKLRMKREVIYSFTDVLSMQVRSYSLWSFRQLHNSIFLFFSSCHGRYIWAISRCWSAYSH